MQHRKHSEGFLLVLILIFGAIFFVIIVASVNFIVTQSQVQESRFTKERALDIAEAGLNYYKWFLAHNPDDTTNGTGAPGPYVHPYEDPESGEIGEFSLEIASSTACGDIYAIDIYSTGYTSEAPSTTRTIYGRYARPTVSEYAYIINANVWAGPDRTIIGPYHSNAIIRMDGTNNSTVTSGQESWTCDNDQLNCDPPHDEGDTLDAVFGSGPNNDLWSFPSPPIDFMGLTVDLAEMKDKADNGGIHLGPSGDYGYRLDFQSDSTVDVYVVDRTYSYSGYTSQDLWQTERNIIDDEYFLRTYPIPDACRVIFVEDKVWLEGEVSEKVSIAVADLELPIVMKSIVLEGDITYTNDDAGLLVVGQDDVLVGVSVPDDMTLEGIFVAQNGRFGRNHYNNLPGGYGSYRYRNSLTINGTIVSNERVGTKWTSGNDPFISGFNTRYNSYDRDLVSDPPPLTPEVSETYEFIEWREVE